MNHHLKTQPSLSLDEARKVLSQFYGITGELTQLDSERDQNFLVSPTSVERQYVLKIANGQTNHEQLELENEVMLWLGESTLAGLIPQPIVTLGGSRIETHHSDSSAFPIRMIDYCPGQILADARPQSDELLNDFGLTLGHLVRAMIDFKSPRRQSCNRQDFHWNLDRFESTMSQYRSSVTDFDLVDLFIKRHQQRVQPVREQLRKCLLHNDANDHNVILSTPSQLPQTVAGLIDFGDMVFGSLINELAIATAYVMLGKNDPLHAAAQVVKGFNEVFPLEDHELDILFELSCARLCTSVVMAAHQRSLNPSNEYLSVTDQPARATLTQLGQIAPDFAAAYFKRACNQEPFPTAKKVSNWIAETRDQFSPIMGQPLTQESIHVFDFSVESHDPIAGDLGSDVPEKMFQELSRLGKSVGIGRYLEPRICYQGEQFEPDGEASAKPDAPEPRTIHMGVDLFAEADTPLHAPLDGRVHSFADNDIPFDYGPTIILSHQVEGLPEFYTLYGHLTRDSISNLQIGQAVQAGEPMAKIGFQHENGGWAPHLHFQVMTHDLELSGNYPGVVKASEIELWKKIILDPYDLLQIPRESVPSDSCESNKIAEKRHQHLNPSLSLSYENPIHIVRGRQQYLFDNSGRSYLDCVNNVCHVGHCHPKVVNAATSQLGLLNTNTRYLHRNIVNYAERLIRSLPDGLDVCFLVNSGSEANDLALRLARNHTQRQEIICVEGGYHGNLSSLIEISPYKYNSPGGKGKPLGIHELPLPDLYRGLHLDSPSSMAPGEFYANFIQDAITRSAERNSDISNSDQQTVGHDIAAFICESILSCGGQIVLPDNFLQLAYQHCRRAGILCIADEVQVGFGRVGSDFWGFQTQGVTPDIVTMGKPIGNGFPIGAVVTSHEIAENFNNGMEYFNTYGGGPVACAVGEAVLDVIESEGLQLRAKETGDYFVSKLKELQAIYPLMGDVRGMGLFLGIEFVRDTEKRTPNPGLAAYVVERMKSFRILLSTDGPHHNVIKIKPPLCFSRSNVDMVVNRLSQVLTESLPKAFLD